MFTINVAIIDIVANIGLWTFLSITDNSPRCCKLYEMVGKFCYPDFHGSFIVLCIRMPAIIIIVNGEIDNSAATYHY